MKTENFIIDVNVDIRKRSSQTLGITLMSQDINNYIFTLKLLQDGELLAMDDSYEVEVLSLFTTSKTSRLVKGTIRTHQVEWVFDTSYISKSEAVKNYVYVRKDGELLVSADANCFIFNVGLSEIDKGNGKVAETYDENYQRYLDEFKEVADFTKIEAAENERQANELLREENYNQKVDLALAEADIVNKVDTKVSELSPQITSLAAQLAQAIAMQTGLLVFKGADTTANINAKTGMVTGDYWWSTDGLTYLAYTGTAWSNVGSSLTELSNIRLGADAVTYPTAGEAVRKQFKDLYNATEFVESSNLIDTNLVTQLYYMDLYGVPKTSATLGHTDFIPVSEGHHVVFSATNASTGVRALRDMRFITAYNASKVAVFASGQETKKFYDVPAGIAFIVITYSQTLYSDPMLNVQIGDTVPEYEAYFEPYYTPKDMPSIKGRVSSLEDANGVDFPQVKTATMGGGTLQGASASLTDGGYILLEDNTIKKNKNLAFNADITTFSSVMVGHGETSSGGNYLTIDATNIKYYEYTSVPVLKGTYVHGLTLSSFIRVVIDTDKGNNAKVTLMSAGGDFTVDLTFWRGSRGQIFAKSVGSTLTDCTLTWSCDDYKKNIYAFGDSYFGNDTGQRWIYQLLQMGYDNLLIDAYAGRDSLAAYTAFQRVLSHGTPKYVLWALGMNDIESGAMNANWQATVESVIAMCLEKGIELILTTTPNTPTRSNAYKNAYVRASGYRYIDFAQAVGATAEGSSWYAGMLNADNVHPETLGAKALLMQALCDFPELMVK